MRIIVKKKESKKKRAMLKNVVINEISSVGRGANEGARVTLLKTADDGMKTFSELLRAEKIDDEVLNDTWRIHRCFQDSIRSIITDDSITDKRAAMQEQLAPLMSAYATMVDDAATAAAIHKAFKTEGGEEFPAKDYAYVPDKEKPSTWKLRLTSTPGEDPDPRIIGMAVAALSSGFRGQKVQIPTDDRAKVVARVRAAWLKANKDKGEDDLPAVLKKSDEEEKNMSKELEKLQKSYDELQAKLAKSEFLASLTDIEKTHYAGLDDKGKEAFEKMDADARNTAVEAAIAKKAADDETIEVEGAVIRKSEVGPGVFAFMKSQQVRIDKAEKKADKLEAEAVQKSLEDEAEKLFPHLTGTPAEKADLLKGIRALPADKQEAQIKIMKAADASMAKGMKEIGQGGKGEEDSAAGKLNKMAKEHAEKNKVTFEKAYSDVLETEEGKKLYGESLTVK